MDHLAETKAGFLSKVEDYATGQSSRFALPLDELIRWSEEAGLVFARHGGANELVKFCLPGTSSTFWAATPRRGDGGKFTLLSTASFPERLRAMAREEFARIEAKPQRPDGVPELPFTQLIWEPYRKLVLELMGKLLEELKPAEKSPPAELTVSQTPV